MSLVPAPADGSVRVRINYIADDGERHAVRHIHETAFGGVEEADVVDQLRSAHSLISLAAEQNPGIAEQSGAGGPSTFIAALRGRHRAPAVRGRRVGIRRTVAAVAVLLVGAISMAAAARHQQVQPKVVETKKVRDNLYVLQGGGGNTVLFIGSTGVVVVDTKLDGWGPSLLARIRELTPKPVTMVINTHSHADHVSGNVDFPATVDVVAHENTRRNIEAWPRAYGLDVDFPNVIRDAGGTGMPKRTFRDRLTIGSGADRIDLLYFGRAHTDGDAWVLFPALRVMASGDAFPNKDLPGMDKNAGGSGVEFAETVTKAYNMIKEVDVIVTGHATTTMTRDDLKTYGEFVRDFVTAVREAKKQGKSAEDIASSWKVPAKYAGYSPAQAASVKIAAQVVMDEIK